MPQGISLHLRPSQKFIAFHAPYPPALREFFGSILLCKLQAAAAR
jgi:hypothetical protein